jgi:hydrogenase expression/formation protein HypD
MELAEVIGFLRKYDGPEVRLMEVCGTHTAAIFNSGIRDIISPRIKLISGPGCPVCVTSPAYIDKCVEQALAPGHELLSFGDMFKVQGSRGSIAGVKSEGGRVRLMYSPEEALEMAEANPDVIYVIAAVGFETTLPVYALVLEAARRKRLSNIKLVTALKAVAPAIEWILDEGRGIDGFICPGHVSVVTGTEAYEALSVKYGKPFVVAGFEGELLMAAIYAAVKLINKNHKFMNLYPSAVRPSGNKKAMALIDDCFAAGDAAWRGIGIIPGSGFYIREEYRDFDAGSELATAFAVPEGCRCGDVVTGMIDPKDCPMFGHGCDPVKSLGPCMTSAEGACGIWYRYCFTEA